MIPLKTGPIMAPNERIEVNIPMNSAFLSGGQLREINVEAPLIKAPYANPREIYPAAMSRQSVARKKRMGVKLENKIPPTMDFLGPVFVMIFPDIKCEIIWNMGFNDESNTAKE